MNNISNKVNTIDFKVKSSTIKHLADYENKDNDMKVSLNQIGLNINTAIDNGMIALPKLTNNKSINEFCSKFSTDVLELVWNDVSATQKAALRLATPIGVALSKFKFGTNENNKPLSKQGNIWVKGEAVPENLNKDGASKIALNNKDITKFCRQKLKLIESKDKSTPMQLATNKVINLLNELDTDEKTGNYVISERDLTAIKTCQKIINSKLAEINAEKIDVRLKEAV